MSKIQNKRVNIKHNLGFTYWYCMPIARRLASEVFDIFEYAFIINMNTCMKFCMKYYRVDPVCVCVCVRA